VDLERKMLRVRSPIALLLLHYIPEIAAGRWQTNGSTIPDESAQPETSRLPPQTRTGSYAAIKSVPRRHFPRGGNNREHYEFSVFNRLADTKTELISEGKKSHEAKLLILNGDQRPDRTADAGLFRAILRSRLQAHRLIGQRTDAGVDVAETIYLGSQRR
jgi:hypothetical protein